MTSIRLSPLLPVPWGYLYLDRSAGQYISQTPTLAKETIVDSPKKKPKEISVELRWSPQICPDCAASSSASHSIITVTVADVSDAKEMAQLKDCWSTTEAYVGMYYVAAYLNGTLPMGSTHELGERLPHIIFSRDYCELVMSRAVG
jgi:hypothetical protein